MDAGARKPVILRILKPSSGIAETRAAVIGRRMRRAGVVVEQTCGVN
jgi:hypothetical protein